MGGRRTSIAVESSPDAEDLGGSMDSALSHIDSKLKMPA